MGKLVSKTRILIWAVIALAVLNVATIVTVIWQMGANKKALFPERFEMRSNKAQFKGKIIKEKLQFTSVQSEEFDNAEQRFRERSREIFRKMKTLRGEMVKELTNDNPDSAVLKNLNQGLGNLHIDLKTNTFDFYFAMKKICRPDQQKALSCMFRDMFLNDEMRGHAGTKKHKPGRGTEDKLHIQAPPPPCNTD